MLTEEKIKEIVDAHILKTEKLGDRAGGSGHMSFVYHRIDGIESRPLNEGKTEISFDYTLLTETEFTYYPDNPPYESPYKGVIVVNSEGQVI
ncbi:hypothetical protein ACFLS7_06590 [Bacteroidota bacterium]